MVRVAIRAERANCRARGDVHPSAGRRELQRTTIARAVARWTEARVRVRRERRLTHALAARAGQPRREAACGHDERGHSLLVARWPLARILRERVFAGRQSPAGDIRRLCPVGDPNAGSWSASDLILFSDRGGISSVPAAGGTCHRIMAHDTGAVMRAVLLPDGNRMLYARGRLQRYGRRRPRRKRRWGRLPVQSLTFSVAAPDYLIFAPVGDASALDIQRVDLWQFGCVDPRRACSSACARGPAFTRTASCRDGALAYLPGVADLPYLEYRWCRVSRHHSHRRDVDRVGAPAQPRPAHDRDRGMVRGTGRL